MKMRSRLAAGLVLLSRFCPAQETAVVPDQVVLTGVTSILGDRCAFFKVTYPGSAAPLNFMLAEGQGRYGIRLVSVDVEKNNVSIRSESGTRTIPICATPNLMPPTPTASLAGGPGRQKLAQSGADFSAAESTAAEHGRNYGQSSQSSGWGVPGFGGVRAANSGGDTTAPPNNGSTGAVADNSGNTASSNAGSADGTGSSDSQASAGTLPPGTHVYQYWEAGAQQIEQARMDTADRVLAGQWAAYPLTPLTPSGTDPQLVGTNSVFMDHGPGVVLADASQN